MMRHLLTVLSFLCLSTITIQAQTWDCDCEETDWESTGICIQVALDDTTTTQVGVDTFETWVPSECFAECWGFTNYVVVECDTTGFDWEWDDEFDDEFDDWVGYDCDCPESDLESEGICIEVTLPDSLLLESGLDSLFGEFTSFQTWVPSECYAACCGFTDYIIIDCDSIDGGFNDWDFGDDFNDELLGGFDCECEESDLEGEGICIEVTFPDTLFGDIGLDSLFGENLSQANVMRHVGVIRTM